MNKYLNLLNVNTYLKTQQKLFINKSQDSEDNL